MQERTHNGEKAFECDVCKKTFSRSDSLAIHKRTHTGEKPYECDVCNKRFAHSSNLPAHKRTHTREKHYECDVCKKTFSQSNGLAAHKKVLHNKTNRFECAVCKNRYKQKRSLNRHQKSHRNNLLSCNTCGREIIAIDDVQEHTISANSQCDVCRELEAKEPTGIGYICFVCDAEFQIASELEHHMDATYSGMLVQ